MPEASMQGKVCLVTGATAGIGLVTAQELARLGARVMLVGRSTERGESALAQIRAATETDAVEFIAADLSAQAEVRRLATTARERCQRLDVLVNNAGAMFEQRRESVDGIEMTFALNHLAYFLLTNLLLDLLKASAPARIINVASRAHEDVPGFDFADPQARRGGAFGYGKSARLSLLYTLTAPPRHPAFRQYARTKLANLLFTFELARQLEGTGVTANALHPGFVRSEFMAGGGALNWFLRRWVRLLGVCPEKGARTSVYLATSPEVAGVSGKYFEKCREATPSAAACDAVAARRLWELSEELTGLRRQPSVTR